MLTTFSANVARSVALSDVAVLLMEKCEAWYSASQARKAAATVSQYCCVAGSSIVAAAAGLLRGVWRWASLRRLWRGMQRMRLQRPKNLRSARS